MCIMKVDGKNKLMRMIENLLTTTTEFVQFASFRRWLRALAIQMKSVKGD